MNYRTMWSLENKLLKLFIVCLFLGGGVLSFHAQSFPKKEKKLVYDGASILTADQEQQLEYKARIFYDSSAVQIAIVTISSLEGYDPNDYAQKLGEFWGVGQSGTNSGVILLVAPNDRKVSIQTGRGLEATLPDIITQRIIQNYILPAFRLGDYYTGIDRGVDNIILYSSGEFEAPKNGKGAGWIVLIVFICMLLMIFFMAIYNNKKGGGRQIITNNGGDSWWTGGTYGGGGWGGGFSGGSSGGGFGGFGGGSFGGGGSSGSW